MFRSDQLLIDRDGHIVTLILNRPEARNAFGLEMLAALADAWQMCDDDPDVRAIVLTGAGGNFCAGSDLKAMGQQQSGELAERFEREPKLHWKALLREYRPKAPVIAAVEGYAVAGGTEILQGTDLRVAGRSARFGVAEVKWGLFPLGGSTVRLRRQIGFARAAEMLLTGRQIDAETAADWGLVGRVVEDGEALATARALAAEIAACGPLAVQAVKRSMIESDGLPEAEALAQELAIGQPIFATDDAKEGPRAFAEKRKPEFQGK